MATIQKFTDRDLEIKQIMEAFPNKSQSECEERIDEKWNKLRNEATLKIPTKFRDAKLSDFEPKMVDYVLKTIFDIFSAPKKDSSDKIGVIITGTVGTGKTHLAYAIVNKLIEINPEMVLMTDSYSEIMNKLKDETFKRFTDDDYSLWDVITNTNGAYYKGILFMDDMSAKNITDFEADRMTRLLDHRINEYYPMMMTTNLDQSEFYNVLGDRISSRLLGNFHIIELEGLDKRLEK